VYILGGVAAVLLVGWVLLALAWTSSVSQHTPELRETAQQVRYGWKCPKCGRAHAPTCKINKCGGPLVWVQRGKTIKCARCHRRLVPHPFLFSLVPKPRLMWCGSCRRVSLIREWKVA